MSLPMSLILAPSNITCKLSGKYTISGNELDVLFPIFTGSINEISLEGSGVSGQYIYHNGTNTTSITLKGSGGGNLAGTPEIIYINMKGFLEIKPNAGPLPAKTLHFTALTITGESALMTLVNSYGEHYNVEPPLKKVFTPENITLTNAPISITYVNCTRYITLGDMTLTFTFN